MKEQAVVACLKKQTLVLKEVKPPAAKVVVTSVWEVVLLRLWCAISVSSGSSIQTNQGSCGL